MNMTSAYTTVYRYADAPSITNMFDIIDSINAPIITPGTVVPRPPKRLAPPRTDAIIALNS